MHKTQHHLERSHYELVDDALASQERMTGAELSSRVNSSKIHEPTLITPSDKHEAVCAAYGYACGRYVDSKRSLCSNGERVNKDVLEALIIGPVKADLLSKDRVERMAREMEAEFARQMRERADRSDAAPKVLQELDARIARLKGRLAAGDADMADDEIQAAIDRAEAKRRDLAKAVPLARETARVLSMLPKAAALYAEQIKRGLAGDPRATAHAREILKNLLGPVTLTPGRAKGELWASYKLNPAALVVKGPIRTGGSGGWI